jgi:hypothetical protein
MELKPIFSSTERRVRKDGGWVEIAGYTSLK